MRPRQHPRWLAALAACGMVAAIAGCSGSGSTQPPATSPKPDLSRLIASADLASCPTTTAGVPAARNGLPDITLHCIGRGPSVDLADLRGEPTVINLYGTWCAPCGREAGFLSQAAAADRRTVRFIGVDSIDPEAPAAALRYAMAIKPPSHFALLNDLSGAVIRHFVATGPPVTLFVTAAGSVVHVAAGPYASTAAVQADIKRYLGVP